MRKPEVKKPPKPAPKYSDRKHLNDLKNTPISFSIACHQLTRKMMDDIAVLLKKGLPLDSCVDFLGITAGDVWSWKGKGEKAERLALLGDTSLTPDDILCIEFLRVLRRALAEYKLSLVERLHQPNNLGWYQNMAILERRDRANWGRLERMGGDDSSYQPDQKFL